MISFRNDYSEGAHPQVLAALEKNNLITTCGYSMDRFCDEAKDIVRARFSCPQADVHFMVGGTIANTTVIAAALRPWEGVIAADTGHINVHETGAIEASGHKVCAIEAPDGKLTPALVREVMRRHCDGQDEHMVLPRMVYISDATELGTIYTKSELSALHDVCREYGLYLFLDGARLPAALVAAGKRSGPGGFCELLRCLLHRRHEKRPAVRRGPCHHKRQSQTALPQHDQAARRHVRQGLFVRDAV